MPSPKNSTEATQVKIEEETKVQENAAGGVTLSQTTTIKTEADDAATATTDANTDAKAQNKSRLRAGLAWLNQKIRGFFAAIGSAIAWPFKKVGGLFSSETAQTTGTTTVSAENTTVTPSVSADVAAPTVDVTATTPTATATTEPKPGFLSRMWNKVPSVRGLFTTKEVKAKTEATASQTTTVSADGKETVETQETFKAESSKGSLEVTASEIKVSTGSETSVEEKSSIDVTGPKGTAHKDESTTVIKNEEGASLVQETNVSIQGKDGSSVEKSVTREVNATPEELANLQKAIGTPPRSPSAASKVGSFGLSHSAMKNDQAPSLSEQAAASDSAKVENVVSSATPEADRKSPVLGNRV